MSHTRVKCSYEDMGDYGSTVISTLYCHHNHSNDITTVYEEDGTPSVMCFVDWSIDGKDKLDALYKVLQPFKGEWGNSELKEGVSFYSKIGE